MCGRFTLKTSPARIKEMFRLQGLGEFDPRYNIAPSQPVLAVRIEPERGEREATFLKRGLIPSWAKEPGIGNNLANARADSVATKPAFRSAFKKPRCLVITLLSRNPTGRFRNYGATISDNRCCPASPEYTAYFRDHHI